MGDVKFSLPGSETVTISGQTIDKLIRAGDGDAALLYLYILKTHGQSTSAEAAAALGKSPRGIATEMAVLSRLGLVQLNDAAENEAKDALVQDASPAPPIKEPRKYSEAEVKREIFAGSEFATVIEETQRKLARILSPDELMRLFGIYDSLRLPPEVILQLLTHCMSESRLVGDGRPPTMRYIEKEAYVWEREGIFSLDRAEEYLKALTARRDIRAEIKKALQIKDREFSATEKRFVDGWIALGFEVGAVDIAYDRTVLKTGKLSWAYMDSILKNWHSKGIHTARQVTEKDSKQGAGTGNTSAKPGDRKYGEPNNKELERMQKLLNKIKEE
jgi:DnaD/phage-associated family protein